MIVKTAGDQVDVEDDLYFCDECGDLFEPTPIEILIVEGGGYESSPICHPCCKRLYKPVEMWEW